MDDHYNFVSCLHTYTVLSSLHYNNQIKSYWFDMTQNEISAKNSNFLVYFFLMKKICLLTILHQKNVK